MRVLVAGASSVPGLPVIRELVMRGHRVFGMTRSSGKVAPIAAAGAEPVTADVFDPDQLSAVLTDTAPEVVISLLITLPGRGPMWMRDFNPARALWDRGVANLVAAAQRAEVGRVVAESMIFAYGYPLTGPALRDESEPYPGPPPPGGAAMLASLRGMEQVVLTSGERSRTEGVVLRYGIFYGDCVPHIRMMSRLANWWALPVPSGSGMLSWIDIDDVARATVDAAERGRGGQIYNIVDDAPMSFRDWAANLAARQHRPRPLTVPNRLVRLVAPYPATAFGTTWLPLSNTKAKAELGWSPLRGSA